MYREGDYIRGKHTGIIYKVLEVRANYYVVDAAFKRRRNSGILSCSRYCDHSNALPVTKAELIEATLLGYAPDEDYISPAS